MTATTMTLCSACIETIGGAAGGPDSPWREAESGEACQADDCVCPTCPACDHAEGPPIQIAHGFTSSWSYWERWLCPCGAALDQEGEVVDDEVPVDHFSWPRTEPYETTTTETLRVEF